MGDGDRKPPMGKSVVWGHSLHTQRPLAQLLPYATCVESSHMHVRLLQVRPIQVGFLVFRTIHVGTLQLHFKILVHREGSTHELQELSFYLHM